MVDGWLNLFPMQQLSNQLSSLTWAPQACGNIPQMQRVESDGLKEFGAQASSVVFLKLRIKEQT